MPAKHPVLWSPADDQFLRDNYLTMTHDELAAALNRSRNAVRHRCAARGLRRKAGPWTADEQARIAGWYTARAGKPLRLDDLAKDMGRAKTSIAREARDLGLTDYQRTTVEKINGRWPSDAPKYATQEERSKANSERSKRRIAEQGHPRGALGMKHTEATKQRLRESSTAAMSVMSAEEFAQRGRKSTLTKIERYGTAAPINVSNPYSRAQRGYIDDIPGIHFRSMWECNYARYLDWLKDQGEIREWAYEADTFIFHGVTKAPVMYLPDFRVTERDGSVVYHEVKGWMDSKSKSKLKRMAKFYPDVRVIVVDEAGYKAIARSVSSIVPFWGDPPKPKDKTVQAADAEGVAA